MSLSQLVIESRVLTTHHVFPLCVEPIEPIRIADVRHIEMIERREEDLKVFVIWLECDVGGILTLYKSVETQRMLHYLHISDMGNHHVALAVETIAWSETHHSWNASEIDLPHFVLHGRCRQKTGQRNTDVVGLEDTAGIIAWIVFQNPLVGFHPKMSIVVVL